MTNSVLSSEIIRNLSYLKRDEQNRVLAYIKSLINKKKGGKAGLLSLAGSFTVEETLEMTKVIEEGCENINYNEWQ